MWLRLASSRTSPAASICAVPRPKNVKCNRCTPLEQHNLVGRHRKLVQRRTLISRKSFDGSDEVTCEVIQAIAVQLHTSGARQKSMWGGSARSRRNQCSMNRHGLSGIFDAACGAEPAVCAQWVFQ